MVCRCAVLQGSCSSLPLDDPIGTILAKPQTGEPVPRYTSLLQHFAIVIDGTNGTVSVYSDGTLVGNPQKVCRRAICAAYDSDFHVAPNATKAKQKDESKNAPKTFSMVFLGAQNVPGESADSLSPDKPMELQQVRIYESKALSATEIKAIHDTSVDSHDRPLKQCTLVGTSGKDALGWKDTLGHDCAWYSTNREAFPFICSGSGVSDNCKVACARQQCYNPKRVERYYLGAQIQMFTEPSTLCVSSNIFDERGLPTMNASLFKERACGGAPRPAPAVDETLLSTSSGTLNTFYRPAIAPTLTTWAIAPEGASSLGNVTLAILALDIDTSSVKVCAGIYCVHNGMHGVLVSTWH